MPPSTPMDQPGVSQAYGPICPPTHSRDTSERSTAVRQGQAATHKNSLLQCSLRLKQQGDIKTTPPQHPARSQLSRLTCPSVLNQKQPGRSCSPGKVTGLLVRLSIAGLPAQSLNRGELCQDHPLPAPTHTRVEPFWLQNCLPPQKNTPCVTNINCRQVSTAPRPTIPKCSKPVAQMTHSRAPLSKYQHGMQYSSCRLSTGHVAGAVGLSTDNMAVQGLATQGHHCHLLASHANGQLKKSVSTTI
jgi:hypothetical protein